MAQPKASMINTIKLGFDAIGTSANPPVEHMVGRHNMGTVNFITNPGPFPTSRIWVDSVTPVPFPMVNDNIIKLNLVNSGIPHGALADPGATAEVILKSWDNIDISSIQVITSLYPSSAPVSVLLNAAQLGPSPTQVLIDLDLFTVMVNTDHNFQFFGEIWIGWDNAAPPS